MCVISIYTCICYRHELNINQTVNAFFQLIKTYAVYIFYEFMLISN